MVSLETKAAFLYRWYEFQVPLLNLGVTFLDSENVILYLQYFSVKKYGLLCKNFTLKLSAKEDEVRLEIQEIPSSFAH